MNAPDLEEVFAAAVRLLDDDLSAYEGLTILYGRKPGWARRVMAAQELMRREASGLYSPEIIPPA